MPESSRNTCVAGFVVLCAYGLIPTLQPEGSTFARVYAVYGGIFIAMAYGWGWLVDGDKPDTGDIVGAVIAVAGVMLAWFWPRACCQATAAAAAAGGGAVGGGVGDPMFMLSAASLSGAVVQAGVADVGAETPLQYHGAPQAAGAGSGVQL